LPPFRTIVWEEIAEEIAKRKEEIAKRKEEIAGGKRKTTKKKYGITFYKI
jgi:hypothetical protein